MMVALFSFLRDLAKTDDYLIISGFYGKILKKLDVL